MSHKLMLTGDVNLMNVTEPGVPFRLVTPILKQSDFVFSNLECCFYVPPRGHAVENEGFMADPTTGEALKLAGIQAVGIANNVNYGEAAIKSSIARLDELGVLHTGAGPNREAARAPVVLERGGLRVGFLQRTSVYWPTNHEAGEKSTGVAVIRGHTAYQLPLHKTRREVPPANRPGIPPVIVTWADPQYLQWFKDDIAALRKKADIVVASCHWGLWQEVLQYMTDIAHAAIDAGADAVMGHGPHYSLPVEVYRGKPIFYGLGSFSFHTGHHDGVAVGDWVGMLARITLEKRALTDATFQFVRHNASNETMPCALANEGATLEDIAKCSAPFGTKLSPLGDEVRIELKS
ncbi:MAG: CapA family protein [Gammaproteobacteria bacterium]|nr:CapA family protein [Gammaproteobacteria bacterium]